MKVTSINNSIRERAGFYIGNVYTNEGFIVLAYFKDGLPTSGRSAFSVYLNQDGKEILEISYAE